MKILFVNHHKSQCGIYELGNRIFGLIDQSILPSVYEEVNTLQEYHKAIGKHKPDAVVYNYYPATMPFLDAFTTNMLPKIKHFGIIHDPLDPGFLNGVNQIFDAWIIHDDTAPLNHPKKFRTVRPIPRFTRTTKIDYDNISIGTHGFPVSPWKMYDTMAEYINESFDNITINMNLTVATFGGTLKQAQATASKCQSKITKPGIKLNVTHDYIPGEQGMIDWLSKNTMNIYFYNPGSNPYVGVGASADLAIASQSSLVVNDSYMYRHINSRLGSGSNGNIHEFLKNADTVKTIYEEWSPERMTNDYKNMIYKIIN
jgi:hypothetical protein